MRIVPTMQTSAIDIPTPDGVANAYLARPDDEPHPGVLFLMDAFGLRSTIEEMARRIAADGYVVLAPNVLYRGGRDPVGPMPDLTDPEQRASFFQSLRPLFEQLTPDGVSAWTLSPRRALPGRWRSPVTAWADGWAGRSPRLTRTGWRRWARSTPRA